MKVDGTARASKPLAYQGTLIEGIEVTFEGGRITKASAKKGEEAWLNLLDTDEGARRLGEVALVPHASPISESGVLFLNGSVASGTPSCAVTWRSGAGNTVCEHKKSMAMQGWEAER